MTHTATTNIAFILEYSIALHVLYPTEIPQEKLSPNPLTSRTSQRIHHFYGLLVTRRSSVPEGGQLDTRPPQSRASRHLGTVAK